MPSFCITAFHQARTSGHQWKSLHYSHLSFNPRELHYRGYKNSSSSSSSSSSSRNRATYPNDLQLDDALLQWFSRVGIAATPFCYRLCFTAQFFTTVGTSAVTTSRELLKGWAPLFRRMHWYFESIFQCSKSPSYAAMFAISVPSISREVWFFAHAGNPADHQFLLLRPSVDPVQSSSQWRWSRGEACVIVRTFRLFGLCSKHIVPHDDILTDCV